MTLANFSYVAIILSPKPLPGGNGDDHVVTVCICTWNRGALRGEKTRYEPALTMLSVAGTAAARAEDERALVRGVTRWK